MKKSIIFFAIFILLSVTAFADTGTYVLDKQNIILTPQPNGDMGIEYDIVMSVTGGNIPWLTIGTPTSDYSILTYSAKASNVKNYNQGSWSGVYVGLDKTYYKGETFEAIVKVNQKNFIKPYGNNFSFQFTPTWWDNAVIKEMTISVVVPKEINHVVATKEGAIFSNSSVVWKFTDVPKGKKVTVGLIMPNTLFTIKPVEKKQEVIPTSSGGTNSVLNSFPDMSFMMIFGGILVGIGFIFIVIRLFNGGGDDYSPSIFSSSSDKEVVRHINMKCPNDEADLSKRDIKDVTIDFCETCGGIFFDKKEMESLIKKEVNEKDFNINNIKSFKKTETVRLTCPRCDGTMYKKIKTTDDNKEVVIFVCDDCEGMWVNNGMYQIIKDKRLAQEEEQKKRKTDDGHIYPASWWFFYPHIVGTGYHSTTAFSGGSYGGGGSSSSSSSSVVRSSCACVSCACVSACACACACAGGGAAGCSPKNKIKQIDLEKYGGKNARR